MSQLNSLSDDQLIDRWVSGNDLIFAEIYNRYWDRLLAVAYNRLDDLYDAEECVQDVFCKFWTLRDKFELQGKDLGVYLVQAIRNQVYCTAPPVSPARKDERNPYDRGRGFHHARASAHCA